MSNIKTIAIRSILAVVLIACILVPFMTPAPAQAVVYDRYWIGGTGSWNDTAHWATSSGNVTGGASLPTNEGNVHFDANSFTAASQVVTVDATANCLNMDWTGSDNGGTTNPILAFGAQELNSYGEVKFIANMSITSVTGMLAFRGTSATCKLTTAGLTQPHYLLLKFGAGGKLTLQDNWAGSWKFEVGAGTLDTNNKTITCPTFETSSAGTKTLTLGTSVITNSGSWNNGGTNVTISDTTHTITCTTTAEFIGGVITGSYGTVNLNGTAHVVSGSNQFVNLTRNGTATKTDTLTLTSGTTQTVTGTCALIGNSAVNRLLVQSSTLGTAATLHVTTDVAANWTGTNAVDFMDITSTHDVDFSNETTYDKFVGDCGGNNVYQVGVTGIKCTASSTQTSASTAAWSSAAGWTGSGTSRVPLAQDDVTCSHSKTVDMPRIGRSITFSGTPTITLSNAVYNYGSFTLVSGMTYTHASKANLLMGRDIYTFTSAGKELYSTCFYGKSSAYTLQDNLTMTNILKNGAGTLNLNNKNVTAYALYLDDYAITRTLNMGSGTMTLNGTNAGLNKISIYDATGLTFNADTSTIILTNSNANGNILRGASQTFNNVTVQGAGNYALTITGNNTFNTFTVDRSSANKTLTLTAASNQTMNSFVCEKSTNKYLTINSTAGTAYLTLLGGGTSGATALNLSNNTAVPANSWFYTPISVIGANVNGWSLDAVPNVTSLAPTSVAEITATGRGNVTNLHFGGTTNSYGLLYDINTGHPYAFTANTTAVMGTGIFTQPVSILTPGELYYFVSHVTNDSGYGEGGELTFLTQPLSPTSVVITKSGVNQLQVVWAKGVGADRTLVRYQQGSYPATITDGTQAYFDTGTATTIAGLEENRTYYVSAWSEISEGGFQQYSPNYVGDVSRSAGIADNIVNSFVAMLVALAIVIFLLVMVAQMGNGSPIEEIIQIVIIAVIGIIAFIVVKGVIGI